LQLLRKQANTGTSTALTAKTTLIYAHTISRTLSTCDISLGSLTLLAPEAGDFVESLLLHKVYFSITTWKKNRHCGR